MLKERLKRQQALEEKLMKLDAAYSGSGQGLEGEEDPFSTEKKKVQTSKDLKREQMTPSERIAEQLNVFTKKIILLYFAFLAIPILCVALVLTLISGSISGNTEFVDASNVFDRTRGTTLNGYFSWEEFASSCCCFESDKFVQRGSNITERWVCMKFTNVTSRANGTAGGSFFRTRVDNGGNDGLAIRPMCGLQMATECIPQVQLDDTVQLQCESGWVKSHNVTQYALEILW